MAKKQKLKTKACRLLVGLRTSKKDYKVGEMIRLTDKQIEFYRKLKRI